MLVGILANQDSIIPINHAASFLAMADYSIMGISRVKKLIESDIQNRAEWVKELYFVRFVFWALHR